MEIKTIGCLKSDDTDVVMIFDLQPQMDGGRHPTFIHNYPTWITLAKELETFGTKTSIIINNTLIPEIEDKYEASIKHYQFQDSDNSEYFTHVKAILRSGRKKVNEMFPLAKIIDPCIGTGVPDNLEEIISENPNAMASLNRCWSGIVDYLFLPYNFSENGLKNLERYLDGAYPCGYHKKHKNQLSVIDGVGFAKIEDYKNVVDSYIGDINSILYAPRSLTANGEMCTEHEKIIVQLLDSFHDKFKIIYRPNPRDIDREDIKEMVIRLSDNPSFIFGNNKRGVESYGRSALLITDTSDIYRTFAFSTFRPSIRLLKNIKEPQITHYGINVPINDNLIEAINFTLEEYLKFENSLKETYEKYFMPRHDSTAMAFLAKTITQIISGDKNINQTVLNSRPNSIKWNLDIQTLKSVFEDAINKGTHWLAEDCIAQASVDAPSDIGIGAFCAYTRFISGRIYDIEIKRVLSLPNGEVALKAFPFPEGKIEEVKAKLYK